MRPRRTLVPRDALGWILVACRSAETTRARRATALDQIMVMPMTQCMNMLTVSKAKAHFSGIARRVVRSRKPVIVRVPNGFIQIAPYDLPEAVPPAPRGSLGKFSAEELRLRNTFGETFGESKP